MPVERFAFLADNFAEPFADDRAVDVVIVSPAFIAGVVRRVNVDALDLSGVERQQRLERHEIVALHYEVALARLTAGEFGHVFEQMKGDGMVMVHHRLLANPVEGRHRLSIRRARFSALSGRMLPALSSRCPK